ncbi:MAG: type II toxin-antitoxin system VapB family antitoxin [Pseudohongiella sp.]|nr:type II toxin-antitoxin system VapB family antitoxin [Pseudohongiella sp.]MDP2125792.1 type II toxin-antitoxin system VapB family antitoxin [Pseudohongiella sp.]
MAQYIGKVFMNGRSQAIRLPKELRFESDTVYLRKEGDEVIISPKESDWDAFFDEESAFGDDFMNDREDTPPQERTSF